VDTLIDLTRGAPVAGLLLVLMLGSSLLALYAQPALLERNIFRPHWLVPRSQYHTLVTSAFLHADLPHLLFNAFTFWAFAFGVERRIGSAGFAALYAFGLLVSDAGTWLKHRHDPAYGTLGASGAILAVLFASIVYFPAASLYIMPIPVPIPAPLFAVGYLAYTYYASRQQRGRINHDAHFSGALAGIAFVALFDAPAFGRLVGYLSGLV
jgi:membrane associated rhomboid family serine protease